MCSNDNISFKILKFVLTKTFERRRDSIALQTFCCFFSKMCEKELDVAYDQLFHIFFDNPEPVSRKQGIFLIKTLIQHNKLSQENEENFRKFVVVIEALEESQHLILPTMELVKSLNFSHPYNDFPFIVYRMIINHESSTVKTWGLNFILGVTSNFTDQETVVILNALNSSCNFDVDQTSLEPKLLNDFVQRNFKAIFRNLIEINWTSVPFFRILQIVVNVIDTSYFDAIDSQFLSQLLKQTEIIPRRIKNLVIRLGVQTKYALIALRLTKHLSIESLLPTLINIFNIADGYKCLAKCLRAIKSEEYEAIFNDQLPKDFVNFALITYSQDKPLGLIKEATRALQERDKMIINAMLHATIKNELHNENVAVLVSETIEKIYENAEDRDYTSLNRNAENLETAMQSTKFKESRELQSILQLLTVLRRHAENKPEFRFAFLTVLKIALEFREIFDKAVAIKDHLDDDSIAVIQCRYLILHNRLCSGYDVEERELVKFLRAFEAFVNNIGDDEEQTFSLTLLEHISSTEWSSMWSSSRESLQIMINTTDKLLNQLSSSDDHLHLLNFLEILLSSIYWRKDQDEWINHVTICLQHAIEKCSISDKARVLEVVVDFGESPTFQESSLRDYIKLLLIEKITEVEMLTKDQQIELFVGWEIESKFIGNFHWMHLKINDRKCLRIDSAKILANQFTKELPTIVEGLMEDFAIASKKKPRYFPNAWIHRMKLHYLQILVFCDNLTKRTIDILIHELLEINNQLNVTYLIEILLARHRPNIIEVLKGNVALTLKAPALKSIFSIAVMQLRMEDSFTLLAENFFGIAEHKLETAHDIILPFTMGQNYGVRSYAQAAILVMYKHVKSLFGMRESKTMSTIGKSCETIKEAMKYKNACKFVDNIRQDFRFTLKYDQLMSEETFYYHIIKATKMPFDEIIIYPGWNELEESQFKVAEMEAEPEILVSTDEIEVPVAEQAQDAILNLQQKYMPFKYQIPGERTLSGFPSAFTCDTDQQLSLVRTKNIIEFFQSNQLMTIFHLRNQNQVLLYARHLYHGRQTSEA